MALIDLSMELTREFDDDVPPGSPSSTSSPQVWRVFGRTRQRFSRCKLPQPNVSPTLISVLSLPMQVGLAFRERRIDVATLPQRVSAKVARRCRHRPKRCSRISLFLRGSLARARKSAVKPTAPEKVSFERVLRDAGVDEQSISKLYSARSSHGPH
jgi:hypothetical protein